MLVPDKVVLNEKFSMISEYWDPKIAGELNGQYVKLAKLKGEFIWHSHEHEDELFYVFRGKLKIEFDGSVREVKEGEFIIVPRNTRHRPVAEEETWVVLFEPASTLNTGDIRNDRTKEDLEFI